MQPATCTFRFQNFLPLQNSRRSQVNYSFIHTAPYCVATTDYARLTPSILNNTPIIAERAFLLLLDYIISVQPFPRLVRL